MQMGGMARPGMMGKLREKLRERMRDKGDSMMRPERPMIPPNRGDIMTRPGMADGVREGARLRLNRPAFYPSMKRGGGLAQKGVGMALARGGLVKANGCAQRGKTKGKMV